MKCPICSSPDQQLVFTAKCGRFDGSVLYKNLKENGVIDLRLKDELKPLIDQLAVTNGVMLEVGVYKGEAMKQFMDSGKFRRYFGVDWWSGEYADPNPIFLKDIPEAEMRFDEVAKNYPVVKMKMTSEEASAYFKDEVFDFVYLDGNHNYEFVRKDIDLWWPKVKIGGYFGGHDYSNLACGGVKKAVDETFGQQYAYPDMSWVVKK